MGEIQNKVGDAKKWWQSKTIIGVILAFIPTIIKVFKPELDVDAAGAVDSVWEGADLIASAADGIWGEILTVVGSLLAIWGRIKAQVGIKPKVV
jgi:hypothetical protein